MKWKRSVMMVRQSTAGCCEIYSILTDIISCKTTTFDVITHKQQGPGCLLQLPVLTKDNNIVITTIYYVDFGWLFFFKQLEEQLIEKEYLAIIYSPVWKIKGCFIVQKRISEALQKTEQKT